MTMTKPKSKKCQVPGCTGGDDGGTYWTDPDNNTTAERDKDLVDHVYQAHTLGKELLEVEAKKLEAAAKDVEARASQYRAETERLKQSGELGVGGDQTQVSRGERKAQLDRPTIDEGATEADWSFFKSEWDRYAAATSLSGGAALTQLWSTCSQELRKALHNDGASTEKDLGRLLQRIKSLAVKRSNNLVNILILQGLGQDREETVGAFVARLHGQSDLCDLSVMCSCKAKVSFKEKFTCLQLVRGLYDPQIQEKVLAAGAALPEGQEMGLTDVVKMVEAAELGKTTHSIISKTGGISRLSEHQKSKQVGKERKFKNNTKELSKEKCSFCGRDKHPREQCPAKDRSCFKCGGKGHLSSVCRSEKKKVQGVQETGAEAVVTEAKVNELHAISDEFVGDCFRLSVAEAELAPEKFDQWMETAAVVAGIGSRKTVPHYVCDSLGQWKPGRVEPSARVHLRARVCEAGYRALGVDRPTSVGTSLVGLADTGAQMCVAPVSIAQEMNLGSDDLLSPALQVAVADNTGLQLVGATFMTLEGGGMKTQQMVYFARGVKEFFLSKEACQGLGLVSQGFPRLGEFKPEVPKYRRRSSSLPATARVGIVLDAGSGDDVFVLKDSPGDVSEDETESVEVQKDSKGRILAACGCLRRELPPESPREPPCELIKENVGIIEAWFKDIYASSTFNTCTHQPLPMMKGYKPMRLHMREDVEPVAVHRPAVIPVHWQDKVKKDIERDIRLGVLERVPFNTPVTWCSRMHVVAKKNGEPRRVVDLRPVNAAAKRQTHYVEPPFAQASAIPPGTVRFTSDAWNGYHSVPVDPRDRHVTTFITPWGRLRYTGGPQGHVVTGDAFNRWYDMIMSAMKRKKKCVDDVCGWASTLRQLFVDTGEFLSTTGRYGVVQNPDKFVWGREELEFVGFWVKKDGVQPTDETLRAISEFPRPTDITGVRSWFGLIEQVAWSFSKTTLMEPFRKLLKPKSVFAWDDDLQGAFERARTEIVKLVASGVQSFATGSCLALVTDWSRTGMGFVLSQKRCGCKKVHPSCCKEGWAVIFVGSRFCTPAESKYAPIEGELLGVSWALHKTAHYTLGCPDLLILVDHKPLIGLLTKREIGEIENPRLESLSEKTMRWNFRIEHIAGAKNFAPDALSRYPGPVGVVGRVSGVDREDAIRSEDLEQEVRAKVCATAGVQVISWETVREAGIGEREYADLLFVIGTGKDSWNEGIKDYERFREDLTVLDGVVLFKGRIVIPKVLRADVLGSLHRAHQGSTGMGLRASGSVWWPGLTKDLLRMREMCGRCVKNAPSQPAAPSKEIPCPAYPFQQVATDFFEYGGQSYLVVVDRYTGWPLVSRCVNTSAGELVKSLRGYFCTYGVPEIMSSDGATVYLAGQTQKFLKAWGVHHRVSSSYFPHSNQRAEGAVKTVKRLIADNTGSSGDLDTDAFAAAMLTYRNTPDRDTGLSPSQVLYARKLRDTVPVKPGDLCLRSEWVLTKEAREKALARRHHLRGKELDEHTRQLSTLELGTIVQVQNQHGPHANKWDLSGVVVEVLNFDAYLVKMDGTGRVSKRNRRFLKPIRTYQSLIMESKEAKDNQRMLSRQRERQDYESVLRPQSKDTVETESGLCSDQLVNSVDLGCAAADDVLGTSRDGQTGCAGPDVSGRSTGHGGQQVSTDVTHTAPDISGRSTGRRGKQVSTDDTHTVQEASREIGIIGRPKRAVKAPDRYQAGNPQDRAFNRRH